VTDFSSTLAVGEDGILRDPETGQFLPGTARPRHVPWRGRRGPVTSKPWVGFWHKRALRPQDRWVRKIVAEHAGSLLSDKPEATEGEKHVIEQASIARGVQCLVLNALRESGGVSTEKAEKLLPVLARFADIELRALLAIGLERRAKVIDPMQAVRDAVTRANLPESDSE